MGCLIDARSGDQGTLTRAHCASGAHAPFKSLRNHQRGGARRQTDFSAGGARAHLELLRGGLRDVVSLRLGMNAVSTSVAAPHRDRARIGARRGCSSYLAVVENRRFAVEPEHPRAHGPADSLGGLHRSRIASDPGSVDGARALPDAGAPRVALWPPRRGPSVKGPLRAIA